MVFLEQRSKGLGVWRGPFPELRIPKLFNLRADPFERGEESTLFRQMVRGSGVLASSDAGAGGAVAEQLQGVPDQTEASKL